MSPAPQIDADLVRRLVGGQFPQWASLHVAPVEPGGWDNRTFRLGAHMLVRLPSREAYARQVQKEQTWLPKLAPHLPLPVPRPLEQGRPALGYPWDWSVYEWLDGEPATTAHINDKQSLAAALGAFLVALRKVGSQDGPPPGDHNHFRGAPLRVYDDQARKALATLAPQMDVVATEAVWEAALASTWSGEPVWFHGDISPGNLLIRDGGLGAVIDFGLAGVGDPACDLAFAWTFLDTPSREVFRRSLGLDANTWMRGRGWALWKALIVCAGFTGAEGAEVERARQVIASVLAD